MIKKIRNYIEYKKKIKLLKMLAVNQLTGLVINSSDYLIGFQKLLLTAAKSDDAVELQEMLSKLSDSINPKQQHK